MAGQDDKTSGDRRRAAKIVHDANGNGRVEWVELAPDDPRASQRVKLSIEDGHEPAPHRRRRPTDLRALSEWILLTRGQQHGAAAPGRQEPTESEVDESQLPGKRPTIKAP